MTADARVTAWLDRLEGLHTAATPGPWSAEPTRYGMDVIAAERPDRFIAAEALPADAAAIVAEHNNFGALLALARGVTALRDDLRRDSARYLGRVARGSYDDGVTRAYDHIADKLTRLLADVAPDTGEQA